jgi:hypothetical protein
MEHTQGNLFPVNILIKQGFPPQRFSAHQSLLSIFSSTEFAWKSILTHLSESTQLKFGPKTHLLLPIVSNIPTPLVHIFFCSTSFSAFLQFASSATTSSSSKKFSYNYTPSNMVGAPLSYPDYCDYSGIISWSPNNTDPTPWAQVTFMRIIGNQQDLRNDASDGNWSLGL